MEVGLEEGQDFADQWLVGFAFQGMTQVAEGCFGSTKERGNREAVHLHRGCGNPGGRGADSGKNGVFRVQLIAADIVEG